MITIHTTKGIEEYTDSKEVEYVWSVGVAGELILYRITLHAMLSAKMERRVWKVWAAGEWHFVQDDEK